MLIRSVERVAWAGHYSKPENLKLLKTQNS